MVVFGRRAGASTRLPPGVFGGAASRVAVKMGAASFAAEPATSRSARWFGQSLRLEKCVATFMPWM